MTANSLGIVIRNEAAFHFFMAIGADGCLFHLSFLVVFAVSVTWLGSDAASGCLSGVIIALDQFAFNQICREECDRHVFADEFLNHCVNRVK